jgi:hypothetical protein
MKGPRLDADNKISEETAQNKNTIHNTSRESCRSLQENQTLPPAGDCQKSAGRIMHSKEMLVTNTFRKLLALLHTQKSA